MRKLDNELNYLDLIILLVSNDLDIWNFSFQNDTYIISLYKILTLKRKKNVESF